MIYKEGYKHLSFRPNSSARFNNTALTWKVMCQDRQNFTFFYS